MLEIAVAKVPSRDRAQQDGVNGTKSVVGVANVPRLQFRRRGDLGKVKARQELRKVQVARSHFTRREPLAVARSVDTASVSSPESSLS